MLLEEKKKTSEISEISILPYTKNPKDANLGKGSLTQVLKCRTASYKLHTLRIIRKYISEEKAKVICNAFIYSQFNYALLVWAFCR